MSSPLFQYWQDKLSVVVGRYDQLQSRTRLFHLKLFGFFFVVNVICYWFGMVTAFPELTFGDPWKHYFLMQIPLGLFAAFFEQITFYASIYLIREATHSRSGGMFLVHLTFDVLVDFVIGVIGVFWIVVSMSLASWVVHVWEGDPTTIPITIETRAPNGDTIISQRVGRHILSLKKDYYIASIQDALLDPSKNWKNIYFGFVMSLSELAPTVMHFIFGGMALYFAILSRTRKTLS